MTPSETLRWTTVTLEDVMDNARGEINMLSAPGADITEIQTRLWNLIHSGLTTAVRDIHTVANQIEGVTA